jgi:hypothetical protein
VKEEILKVGVFVGFAVAKKKTSGVSRGACPKQATELNLYNVMVGKMMLSFLKQPSWKSLFKYFYWLFYLAKLSRKFFFLPPKCNAIGKKKDDEELFSKHLE